MNPRWSEDGSPHAHRQLRDDSTTRQSKEKGGKHKWVNVQEADRGRRNDRNKVMTSIFITMRPSISPTVTAHSTTLSPVCLHYARLPCHSQTQYDTFDRYKQFSLQAQYKNKYEMLHWLKRLLLFLLFVRNTLSNGKQPWLPVTQPSTINFLLHLSGCAGTKHHPQDFEEEKERSKQLRQ